jgi:hypothetical protein
MTISQLAHIPTPSLIHEEAPWRTDWTGDARKVVHHLDAIDGSFGDALSEAEDLVRRHWDAIERVADALAERGRLSGEWSPRVRAIGLAVLAAGSTT